MDWPVTIPARLEGGTIKLSRETLRRALDGKADAPLTITIERKHATRSLNQNAYYWSVVVHLLSEHTGYTADEIHEVLKAKFLPKALSLTDGNGEIKDELVIGGTTTRLNKLEFGEFMERVRQWAAEDLHVYIPDPDPAWREAVAS